MAGIDFSDQTVWVTGAGKGIGYATALAFVDAGARVIGFDREFMPADYPLYYRSDGRGGCRTGRAGVSAYIT